jgi:hypothetical protein
MRLIGFSLGVLILAWVVHLVWWRIAIPRRPFLTLLAFLLGFWPGALAVAWSVPVLVPFSPESWWEAVHSALFHVALVLCYIVTYSAFGEDSSTLSILIYLDRAGPAGRCRDDILRMLSEGMIVGGRFDSLVEGGILTSQGEGYMLTRQGRRWAEFFRFFRRIYRLRKGG